MTDFVSWWADHWPLVPILAPAIYYSWRIFVLDLLNWLKRRREP